MKSFAPLEQTNKWSAQMRLTLVLLSLLAMTACGGVPLIPII